MAEKRKQRQAGFPSGAEAKSPPPAGAVQAVSWVALIAALIAAGAFLHINLVFVPITFQDFFVALGGLMLGPRRGILAVLLYTLAGCAGLPVFSGGRSGFAHLLGPTGGYFLGFVFMAGLAGLGARFAAMKYPGSVGLKPFLAALGGCLAGLAALYAAGAAGLVLLMNFSTAQAVAVGILPFLPVGPFKMLAAVMIWQRLKRRGLGPKGLPV